MYLWVDDIRTPPCNDWLWARSTNEAITAIKSYERSFAYNEKNGWITIPDYYNNVYVKEVA